MTSVQSQAEHGSLNGAAYMILMKYKELFERGEAENTGQWKIKDHDLQVTVFWQKYNRIFTPLRW